MSAPKYGDAEDERCLREACAGFMEIVRQGDCSCHISPPCSACVEAPLVCSGCGHEIAYEAPAVAPSPTYRPELMLREKWSKDFGDGRRIFEVDYDGRSGSTMVFKGQYEGPVTPKDIFDWLGDGTFGHRGPTLFGSHFTYTKITD